MNKLDFLRRLDRELSALDRSERKELLAFYEERFYTGTIYENKTEEEVIAELESPEAIARNILSEYGISTKQTRKQVHEKVDNNLNEMRQSAPVKKESAIRTGQVVALVIVDLFILSWAIPTLFSVVVSIGGSLFSYVGILGFLSAGTTYDTMIFWFLTGAYILLFLFFLAVLEFFIWAVKRTIIWHMKVFKYKKVNDWNKRLSKVSVEGWFKRHKFLRFIKNMSGLAAIILITYTGFYLYSNYDEIHELYIDQEQLTEVYTLEVTDDISSLFEWEIMTDIDDMKIEVKPTSGNEIIITRNYYEGEGVFTVEFNEDLDELTIIHDEPTQIFNTINSFEDLIQLLNNDTLVIEVPEDLLLDVVDIKVSNGEVDFSGIDARSITVIGSNGAVNLDSVNSDTVIIKSSNAYLSVKDSSGLSLTLETGNGKIMVRESSFNNYNLDTSNGRIELSNLNLEFKDGVELDADTSNGKVILKDVYVATVDLKTSNGDIEYFNDDETFNVDFTRKTSNGQITTNVN